MSVDEPGDSAALRARLGIELPLYSDVDGKAATAWKVFDADTGIALAASFVVAPGGKVIYRYLGTSKADRPPVSAFLEAIDAQRASPASGH